MFKTYYLTSDIIAYVPCEVAADVFSLYWKYCAKKTCGDYVDYGDYGVYVFPYNHYLI